MKAVMYHYVRPDEPSLPYFRHLHLDDFIQQLDYFADEYTFLTKEELTKALQSRIPVKNKIILTFDDGLKDHYRYVFPELKRRRIWGIFYVPTLQYQQGKLLDVHRIHMLLGKAGGKQVHDSINDLISEEMLSHAYVAIYYDRTYKNQTNDEYTNFVKRTLNYFLLHEHRSRIIDSLMEMYFADEGSLIEQFYVSKEEIQAMHDAGMVIGSHSVNHHVMSKLSLADQSKEITDSFRFLENIVGDFELKTFCYPYGGFHTFSGNTERLLDENQCAFSFNVEARDISELDLAERKQALPRYDCNMFPFGSCRNAPAK